MNQAEQILLAKEYMYQFHKNDYSGHDIAHIERVTLLAKYIAKQEHQGDFLTIVLSALLHDVIDDKLTDKHHGRNNDVTLPIEGQIVRDADRLDAIGAIGIARTFQFSGHFNEPMWTESPYHSIPSEKDMVDLPPSAIRHFYDKLLKLKKLMHTQTGFQLAEERHQFMKLFLSQFYSEWHLEE